MRPSDSRSRVVLLAAVVLAAVCSGAAAQSDEVRERQAMMEKAVQRLILEAREIDEVSTPELRPVWSRPHPYISGWSHDMALITIKRMRQDFTGNEYLDTYIRWHLMHAVRQARQSDRRKMGEDLVALIRQMPGPLNVPFRREWWWDPEPHYNEYIRLAGHPPQAYITKGYPPYQHTVGPPESFKYMQPGAKQAYDQAMVVYKERLKVAEEYRKTHPFRRVVDQKAVEFNRRLRQIRYIMRQYRGELIYALILTGDPKMAHLVFDEVDRQLRTEAGRGIAVDLLSFVYLAAFDGAMGLYDQQTLNELSAKLERTARANEGYFLYARRQRNFADYAFHLVHLLKDGGGFFEPIDSVQETPGQAVSR